MDKVMIKNFLFHLVFYPYLKKIFFCYKVMRLEGSSMPSISLFVAISFDCNVNLKQFYQKQIRCWVMTLFLHGIVTYNSANTDTFSCVGLELTKSQRIRSFAWRLRPEAFGEDLRLPILWDLVSSSPTHEKGPGSFLGSERMGRWSWLVRKLIRYQKSSKLKETNGITY